MATTFDPSPLAARIAADAEVRDRDLGLGSVHQPGEQAAPAQSRRLVQTSCARGWACSRPFAPYSHLLNVSWTTFIGLITLLYAGINLLFAVLYVLCGPDALAGPGAHMLGGRFTQAFFFSIQTFATIGYGQIGPNGFAANMLVTIEALVGLMYQALATGLLFVRFGAADGRHHLQPASDRRPVCGHPGARVPDREQAATKRDHRARGAGALHGVRADRRRPPGTPLPSVAARAEQGDLLPALVDDRASDRREQSRSPARRRRISSASRRRFSSC